MIVLDLESGPRAKYHKKKIRFQKPKPRANKISSKKKREGNN